MLITNLIIITIINYNIVIISIEIFFISNIINIINIDTLNNIIIIKIVINKIIIITLL